MTQQPKTKYKIRNWREYNKALVQRGSLTVWFTEESRENWYSTNSVSKRGRPEIYSDEAILCALLIKNVYRIPFRALQGLLLSLIQLLGICLKIPHYAQICRRAQELGQEVRKLSHTHPTDIVFDSTGMKIYGEGEWKVRQHGKSKRRTWRKVHLGICPDSHEIILEVMTGNEVSDSEAFKEMEQFIPRSVERAYADGAYDKEACYERLYKAGIKPIIPPQRNAVRCHKKEKNWMRHRNEAIEVIAGLGNGEEARKLWKKLTGYHRRSLGETAMYRFKTVFGGSLSSRKMESQKAEVYVRCKAINRMNRLGMPKGKWITC